LLKELVSVTCDYNRQLKEKNNANGSAKKVQEKCDELQKSNDDLVKRLKQAESKIQAIQREFDQQPKKGKNSLLKELVSAQCDYNRQLKEKNNADGSAKKLQEKCDVLQKSNDDLVKRLKQAESKIDIQRADGNNVSLLPS